MCDDSRCFYHDNKELFHRVRSTWTESPNTLDWESGYSGLSSVTILDYSISPLERMRNLMIKKIEMRNP